MPETKIRITVTNYLETISSWCFWAVPMWTELQQRYAGRVEFKWKIALMDASGFPKSRAQAGVVLPAQWDDDALAFHVEAGLVPTGSAGMSRPEFDRGSGAGFWRDAMIAFGWRLMTATVREGVQTGDWETAAEIGAKAGGLDRDKLLERARSPEIEARVRKTTAEFHALQVTQRPTFVIDSEIGDRAVFSGFAKLPPLATTIDAMLDDAVAYEAHAAHFGGPPTE